MNPFAPAALWGFWILLVAGWMMGELSVRGTVVFLLLFAAGIAGSPYILGGALLTPYLAILDIVLALVVFKGDVTLR